ncbi:hypothetical protein GOBAR_AA19311 [Gossypium barbadense]|uniref:Uncharacterized protein n=1 Tax=Gossypium barbadense TaxID=3634 RepID=A0A2P5XDB4_GOSBA|nr:hypothetical protein GOBAR_AA19311 [Gossypium barbadense]
MVQIDEWFTYQQLEMFTGVQEPKTPISPLMIVLLQLPYKNDVALETFHANSTVEQWLSPWFSNPMTKVQTLLM